MMKKSLLVYLLVCLVILCPACIIKETPLPAGEELALKEEPLFNFPIMDGYYIIEDEQLGLAVAIPVRQMEDRTIYNGQFSLWDSPVDTPPLDGMQVFYFPPGLLEEVMVILQENPDNETMDDVAMTLYRRSRLLYSVQFYNVAMWDNWLSYGKTMVDITGNSENIELGRQNDRVYVYTAPTPSEEDLSAEELPSYRQAVAGIPGMRDHVAMLKQAAAPSNKSFPIFSAADIYGKVVDSGMFAEYDITMLNIWGTFCSPCIGEMPDLAEMADALPAGAQLVGLVGDALNEETIELAQNIAERTGAAYPHIVPDKVLFDFLNRNISFYPTTLFIDSQGNIVGEPLIGALSRAGYEKELHERLQTLLKPGGLL